MLEDIKTCTECKRIYSDETSYNFHLISYDGEVLCDTCYQGKEKISTEDFLAIAKEPNIYSVATTDTLETAVSTMATMEYVDEKFEKEKYRRFEKIKLIKYTVYIEMGYLGASVKDIILETYDRLEALKAQSTNKYARISKTKVKRYMEEILKQK